MLLDRRYAFDLFPIAFCVDLFLGSRSDLSVHVRIC